MWRMMPRLAIATLTATIALACLAAPKAGASAVQSYAYTTTGSIDGPGGNTPISFTPTYSGTLTTPGSINLGSFVTNPLPPTATLIYNNTPFTIDLNVSAVGTYPSAYGNYGYNYGYNYGTPTYQYVISGKLNGSITGATSGSGTSSMFATITSISGNGLGTGTAPPFPISDLVVNLPQGIAAAVGSNQSYTMLTGQVIVAGLPLPAPAPEPSTFAVFGVALAGLAYRRARSRAKA